MERGRVRDLSLFKGKWGVGGGSETLYHRDDALSTKPVMHYQGTAYLCY